MGSLCNMVVHCFQVNIICDFICENRFVVKLIYFLYIIQVLQLPSFRNALCKKNVGTERIVVVYIFRKEKVCINANPSSRLKFPKLEEMRVLKYK